MPELDTERVTPVSLLLGTLANDGRSSLRTVAYRNQAIDTFIIKFLNETATQEDVGQFVSVIGVDFDLKVEMAVVVILTRMT